MRHERFVAFEGVYPEKALSMRTFRCPHSQGLHAAATWLADTVKAEKG